jgi:signal transduction histidine kinase
VSSLRARIVGWYIAAGALIVVIVALVTASVLVEARAHEARRAMTAVAAELPSIIIAYEVLHPDIAGLDWFLRERFHTQGVIVHVVGPPTPMGMPLPPPRLGRAPFVGHLIAMMIPPMHVRFPGGDAIIFADPQSLAATFSAFWIFVLILALVVLSASWRISLVVADQTLRPLISTTDALRRFGSGAFTRVAVRNDDRGETAELARAYNAAVDQTTAALAKRDQAEAEMRQFVADAGHQLRTPLTVVTGYLSAMLSRASSAGDREPYESMLAQARRMKTLIDALVTLARLEHRDATPPADFDPDELMTRVRSAFDDVARRCIVLHACTQPLTLRGYEDDVYEALCALVENALKYAPTSTVELSALLDGASCTLTVSDNGPGLAAADLERAYDRFYRGSNVDGIEGSGLGLSIARKSVERSGGTVRLENRPAGGLSASITLPCVKRVAEDERRVAAEPLVLVNDSVANARRT